MSNRIIKIGHLQYHQSDVVRLLVNKIMENMTITKDNKTLLHETILHFMLDNDLLFRDKKEGTPIGGSSASL